MSVGLLVARLVLGLGMAAHGTQKLFGWLGGYGLNGTAGFMEGFGFRPGRFFALVLGLSELGSGLLTALGLGGPIGPALMILMMIVAAVVAHWEHGFFAQNGGIEVPLLYGVAALTLAVTGPGVYSLDEVLGLQGLSNPSLAWAAVALAIAGAVANLAIRRPAPQQAPRTA